MRLLLDQNLSRRLVGTLSADFPRSTHVVECGLDASTDKQVWDFARLLQANRVRIEAFDSAPEEALLVLPLMVVDSSQ